MKTFLTRASWTGAGRTVGSRRDAPVAAPRALKQRRRRTHSSSPNHVQSLCITGVGCYELGRVRRQPGALPMGERRILVIGSQCACLPQLSFLPRAAEDLYAVMTDPDLGGCVPALSEGGL